MQWLSLLLLVFSCDNTGIQSQPKYVTAAQAGYSISKTTQYTRENIFSINSFKDNVYGFNATTLKKEGEKEVYFEKMPHAMYVDTSGNIYINNWIKKKDDTQKGFREVTQIVKMDKNGNLLKKVQCDIEIDYITRLKTGDFLVADRNRQLVILDRDLKTRGQVFDFSFDESVFEQSDRQKFVQLDEKPEKLYRICSFVSRIDLKSLKIDLKYRIAGTDKEMAKEGVNTKEIYVENNKKIEFFEDNMAYNRIRNVLSVFHSVYIISSPRYDHAQYCIGIDQFGNEYFGDAEMDSEGKVSGLKKNMPVSYIVVRTHDRKKVWKLDFPYLYGKADRNALGGRNYHVTPSGIIYVLSVNLKGMHLDKYVPEPVAKKAGGSDKAYY